MVRLRLLVLARASRLHGPGEVGALLDELRILPAVRHRLLDERNGVEGPAEQALEDVATHGVADRRVHGRAGDAQLEVATEGVEREALDLHHLVLGHPALVRAEPESSRPAPRTCQRRAFVVLPLGEGCARVDVNDDQVSRTEARGPEGLLGLTIMSM